jgi:Ala-tRNA(Pro) deacylase
MTLPRFVVDRMLGRLARWLRAMGYDTAYPGRVEDGWLLELAVAENRILVTRDVHLASLAGHRGCLIRSERVDGQLAETVEACALVPSQRDWLSRCLSCNATLERRSKESVREQVPERIFRIQTEFMACPSCRRVYWWGSHADRILARLEGLFGERQEVDAMPILTTLREFLEANNVPYSVHSHPTAYTAQEIAALQKVKGRQLAKVVMVKTGVSLVMLVLPADRQVDFERLKDVMRAEGVRLASEEEFRDFFPGCEVGAMPPFGNLYGLTVYADRSLERDDEIVFNAGTHTLTAKIAFRHYTALVEPVMAEFTVHR